MKKYNKINILVLVTLLFCSCQDIINEEGINNLSTDLKELNYYKSIVCENYIPSIIRDNYSIDNSLKSSGKNKNIHVEMISDNDGLKSESTTGSSSKEGNIRPAYRFLLQSNEKLIPLSALSKIYLGAIYNGLELEKERYNLLSYATNSFKMSTSAPLGNISVNIDNASLSKQREALRSLFSKEPVNKQYVPEEFNFSIEQFSSYEELQFVLHSELDATRFQNTQNINKKTGLYIKCFQRNFSLDMDISDKFIKNGTPIRADNPIYVSSISYGKIALLAIESDYSYSDTESAYRKVTRKFLYKETVTITSRDIEIINNSNISIFSMAENGSGFQAIKGYQAFIEYISKSGDWGKYTSSNPGVPIYTSFSHLKDGSSVNLTYDFKINLPPVYARIEYRNVVTDDRFSKTNQRGDVYLSFYSDPRAFNKITPLGFLKINLRSRELEVPKIEGTAVWMTGRNIIDDIRYSRVTAKENYSRLNSFTLNEKGYTNSDNLITKGFLPVEIFNFNYYDLEGATGIGGLANYDFGFRLRIYSIEKDWYYKILPPAYGAVDYGFYSK